jgi:hypothetical protein
MVYSHAGVWGRRHVAVIWISETQLRDPNVRGEGNVAAATDACASVGASSPYLYSLAHFSKTRLVAQGSAPTASWQLEAHMGNSTGPTQSTSGLLGTVFSRGPRLHIPPFPTFFNNVTLDLPSHSQ